MPITQGLTPDPTSEDGSFLHNILQKDITLSASSSRAKVCGPPSGPLAIRLRGPAPDHPPLYTHPHIYTHFVSRFAGVCQGLLEYALPECVKVCWSMSGLLGFRVLRSSMTILGLLECMQSLIVQGLLEYVKVCWSIR